MIYELSANGYGTHCSAEILCRNGYRNRNGRMISPSLIADDLPGKIILTGIASFSIDSAFVALLSSVIQPLIRPLKQICINNSRYDVCFTHPMTH